LRGGGAVVGKTNRGKKDQESFLKTKRDVYGSRRGGGKKRKAKVAKGFSERNPLCTEKGTRYQGKTPASQRGGEKLKGRGGGKT